MRAESRNVAVTCTVLSNALENWPENEQEASVINLIVRGKGDEYCCRYKIRKLDVS